MKQLTLIRHAKSSWQTGHRDFDRPLNDRGLKAAPYMAERITAHYDRPDLIITSPARRARQTAELIATGIGYDLDRLQEDPELYDASTDTLLRRIQATPDDVNHLYLVAHNPGLTYLANQLTDSRIDNLVTCAMFGATFDINHWSEADYDGGNVVYYDFPKNPDPPIRR